MDVADTSSSSISKNVVEDAMELNDTSGKQDETQSEAVELNLNVPNHTYCDKSTQTGNSKEELELQIKELKRMIASM